MVNPADWFNTSSLLSGSDSACLRCLTLVAGLPGAQGQPTFLMDPCLSENMYQVPSLRGESQHGWIGFDGALPYVFDYGISLV